MMRKLALGVCLLAGTAEATTICRPGCLPRSAFADTESTTNCPFDFGQRGVKNFRFDMTFVGTPSNNVQLAFGRDADADGVLAPEETDMIFAWDCGAWHLRRTAGDASEIGLRSPAVTTNGTKELHWDLQLRRRQPKRLSLVENGEPLFAEFSEAALPWFHDVGWDMLRLTARGVDAPDEEVCVSLNVEGHLFILR